MSGDDCHITAVHLETSDCHEVVRGSRRSKPDWEMGPLFPENQGQWSMTIRYEETAGGA